MEPTSNKRYFKGTPKGAMSYFKEYCDNTGGSSMLQRIGPCVKEVFNVYIINLPVEDVGKEKINCDCLPTGTDLTYNVEISQNTMRLQPSWLMEGYVGSILNLHFKKSHIETKERNELYGFSDFISNFGGLLGLFTGFSILSLIEIIYFLSLRIWGNIKLYKNWSGKSN